MHIDSYMILLGIEIVLQLNFSDRFLQTKRGFIFQIFTAICKPQEAVVVLCQSVSCSTLFPCGNDSKTGSYKMHEVKNAKFHTAY